MKLAPEDYVAKSDLSFTTKNNDTRKVDSNDIIFLWGFRHGTSATSLKTKLQGSHNVFLENFDVCLVDKSCATVVFFKPDLSKTLLGIISNQEIPGFEGLKGASYEVYKRICRQGLWELELADAFDEVTADEDRVPEEERESGSKKSEVYWDNDLIINFNDL